MMGPKTEELLVVLGELIELLEQDGELHWSDWMKRSRIKIKNSDFSGVTLLLGAYGGMGSFNDLIICQQQIGGEWSWKVGYKEKNNQLLKLKSKAYDLAIHIKKCQT